MAWELLQFCFAIFAIAKKDRAHTFRVCNTFCKVRHGGTNPYYYYSVVDEFLYHQLTK